MTEDFPLREQLPKFEIAAESQPGVTLVRTLEGHLERITSLAFDPLGGILASGSFDRTIKLWGTRTGNLMRVLKEKDEVWSVAFDQSGQSLAVGCWGGKIKVWDVQGGRLRVNFGSYGSAVNSVAYDPCSGMLASGGFDHKVRLWDARDGSLRRTLTGHKNWVWNLAFDAQGSVLASASDDNTAKLWDVRSGELLHTLAEHHSRVLSVAFQPNGGILASGSGDTTIKLWNIQHGRLLRTLEGHTADIEVVAFSSDGRLLASKSRDQTIKLWNCETWEPVAVIPAPADSNGRADGLVFHPKLPLLATASSTRSSNIHIWELETSVLLDGGVGNADTTLTVHHTTGKVVLVGDHSVGKSALGYRLINETFKEQAATHGQQFWLFPALGQRRSDGTECEAILWDLAGQPDYRLVHALFVDNADLALVLFDASDLREPLHGVSFWLKQLRAGQSRCPIILVAAQIDRGTSSLTLDELGTFCKANGIFGPIFTSAATGDGFGELIELMKSLIAWNEKPATVTTTNFKRIKDYVLGLKEIPLDGQVILAPDDLRARLEATDTSWRFSNAEMRTAVGHLENYGYVKRLRTSSGEQRILLQPERLNNLASSFVLEARRNVKGLGALEEKRLLAGDYHFPELMNLGATDRDVLLDAATLLFLERNICFRETDPLRLEPYLYFPELINLKKPAEEEGALEDGAAYTIRGPTENVFASLVVLLGYTHTFTRTDQWHNNARYGVGDGMVCGFRQDAERDGELDFVLCFGLDVGPPVRALFQGLFESFLARRNLTVMRYEPVRCTNKGCGRILNRSVVRQWLQEGNSFVFCNGCGAQLSLPALTEPIQLTQQTADEVESQRHVAEQRTRFEQAIFRVQAYTTEKKVTSPETFISYAWGVSEHETWVEKRLATDLQKAGIRVILDRWENQVGHSVSRYVERIEKSDRIVMVGTPAYRRKYDNKDSESGYVVAAEIDLINNRLLSTEADKESVLPVLRDGEKMKSLPPMMHGRVHADFRDESAYFATVFDLILSLYQIAPNHPAVADLRESLLERSLR